LTYLVSDDFGTEHGAKRLYSQKLLERRKEESYLNILKIQVLLIKLFSNYIYIYIYIIILFTKPNYYFITKWFA